MNLQIENHRAQGVMRFLSRTMLAWCLLGGIFLNGAEPVLPAKVAEPDAAAAWQRRIPELFSDNLPLEEIVKELRRKFPEINFLIRNSDADNIDLGAIPVRMTLRAVTLTEILKALELAAAAPIQITGAPDERLIVFDLKRLETGLPPVGIRSRIFNLSKYLGNRDEKEVDVALRELEQVVRQTGHMLDSSNPGKRRFHPQFNFHSGTKLLIVLGRPDELEVVQEVVKELQGQSATNKITSTPERRP